MNYARTFAACIALLAVGISTASAQTKMTAKPHLKTAKMVAYDAKDKKYYSVAWAKAHNWHDKGGDKLILISMAKLPKDAKMSRAMHGKM